MTAEERNKDILRRVCDEIMNQGNLGAALGFFTPNFIKIDLASLIDGVSGASSVKDLIGMVRGAIPDIHFRGMVGSSAMPGGSRDELVASIQRELLVLSDETVVCPGHGQATTIGAERRSNRFIPRECCPAWPAGEGAAAAG